MDETRGEQNIEWLEADDPRILQLSEAMREEIRRKVEDLQNLAEEAVRRGELLSREGQQLEQKIFSLQEQHLNLARAMEDFKSEVTEDLRQRELSTIETQHKISYIRNQIQMYKSLLQAEKEKQEQFKMEELNIINSFNDAAQHIKQVVAQIKNQKRKKWTLRKFFKKSIAGLRKLSAILQGAFFNLIAATASSINRR